MINFVLKLAYILAYPVLKLFKPELTTYDVVDVNSSVVPVEHILRILSIGLSVLSLICIVMYLVLSILYQAPQAVYELKREVISSDESSPLIQDKQFVEDTNKVTTPEANDVDYLVKEEIANVQDEVEALKREFRKNNEQDKP